MPNKKIQGFMLVRGNSNQVVVTSCKMEIYWELEVALAEAHKMHGNIFVVKVDISWDKI